MSQQMSDVERRGVAHECSAIKDLATRWCDNPVKDYLRMLLIATDQLNWWQGLLWTVFCLPFMDKNNSYQGQKAHIA